MIKDLLFSDALRSWASLPLRAILGGGFIYHGFPKLSSEGHAMFQGMLEGIGVPAPGLMAWFVGSVEFIGGVALILGALTSLFAVLLIGNMIVAIVTVHLPFGFNFMNVIGMSENGLQFGMPGYETSLLYLAGLATLLLLGPTHLSVDQRLKAGWRASAEESS
jgi:putative oxidoreductase